jgi:hypothetical protein
MDDPVSARLVACRRATAGAVDLVNTIITKARIEEAAINLVAEHFVPDDNRRHRMPLADVTTGQTARPLPTSREEGD